MEIINYEKTFTIKKTIRLTNKEFKLHLNQANYYIKRKKLEDTNNKN